MFNFFLLTHTWGIDILFEKLAPKTRAFYGNLGGQVNRKRLEEAMYVALLYLLYLLDLEK